MKQIIFETDHRNHIFYSIIKGKKTAFYLTNKLAKTFLPILRKGVLIEFTISDKIKVINQTKAHQVLHFDRIVRLHPYFVFYDINQLRIEMKQVLQKFDHFLFIDFEMTMPSYRDTHFQTELLQAGFVLTNKKQDILREYNEYIQTKLQVQLSKRTLKFLNLVQEDFEQKAIPFIAFYQELKHIMDTYHPKLVVWGKNDITVLQSAYKLHQVDPITVESDFIDLLKLHKDYYHLKDDIGLFKAYKTYYGSDFIQTHDAKHDALVTKHVFQAFLMYMGDKEAK